MPTRRHQMFVHPIQWGRSALVGLHDIAPSEFARSDGHDHANLSVLSVPFSLVHKLLYKIPSGQREGKLMLCVTDRMKLIHTKGKGPLLYNILKSCLCACVCLHVHWCRFTSTIHLVRHPGNQRPHHPLCCDRPLDYWNLHSGCKQHRRRAAQSKAETKHLEESLQGPV